MLYTSHYLTPLSSSSPKALSFAWGCLTGTIFSELILPLFLITVIASKVHSIVPVVTEQNITNRNGILGALKTGILAKLLKRKGNTRTFGNLCHSSPKRLWLRLYTPYQSPSNLMWFQGDPFVSWLQIKPYIQQSYFQKELETGDFRHSIFQPWGISREKVCSKALVLEF